MTRQTLQMRAKVRELNRTFSTEDAWKPWEPVRTAEQIRFAPPQLDRPETKIRLATFETRI